MNVLAAAVVAASLGAGNGAPPPQAPSDLRQSLQQYDRVTAPPPRQLTPVERAELRRQLTETAAPPRRR